MKNLSEKRFIETVDTEKELLSILDSELSRLSNETKEELEELIVGNSMLYINSSSEKERKDIIENFKKDLIEFVSTKKNISVETIIKFYKSLVIKSFTDYMDFRTPIYIQIEKTEGNIYNLRLGYHWMMDEDSCVEEILYYINNSNGERVVEFYSDSVDEAIGFDLSLASMQDIIKEALK